MIGRLLFPAVCPVCRRRAPETRGAPCSLCAAALRRPAAPHCPGCGGTIDGILDYCSECLAQPRPWRHAITAFEFGGAVRELVHRYKYRGDVALVSVLGEAVCTAWEERAPALRPVAITAVPLHWQRRWRRGYNQAELLSRELSRATGLPYCSLLRRARRTPPQAGLSLHQRQHNLRRCFRICGHPPETGGVMLVDDVFTTGATLAAASTELLHGGIEFVDVLTAARG